MTDKQKRTRKEQGNPFDFPCCGDWSRIKPDQAEGCDRSKMMSKMMEMCGSMESETATPEEPDAPDTIV